MGVFHWGCLVSNYGFFHGQCFHSELALVVVSRLVMVDQKMIKHV